MSKASPQLIEPIMNVDVFTPEDHVGDVIGDLNRRRGMIKSQDAASTGVRIKAEVPLAEMFGYIGSLRTMTSGRGQFSMELPTTCHVRRLFPKKWLRLRWKRKRQKPSNRDVIKKALLMCVVRAFLLLKFFMERL